MDTNIALQWADGRHIPFENNTTHKTKIRIQLNSHRIVKLHQLMCMAYLLDRVL